MKIDIEQVASLANLPLNEKEKALFQPQLEKIIAFVEKLNEVDTTAVEPTCQVTGKTNEVRHDKAGTSLTVEQVIANASQTKNSYIQTKGVFNEE